MRNEHKRGPAITGGPIINQGKMSREGNTQKYAANLRTLQTGPKMIKAEKAKSFQHN